MLIGSIIQIYPFDFKPSAPPAGSFIFYAKTDDTLYIQDSSGTEFAFGATGFITQLTGDVSAMGPGSAVATVNFVGGSSAANVHLAELAANAATAVNTASTIVKRDSSGNFAAGIITAALNGNAATATTSVSFSGSLAGDVTGTQAATVVSLVGGASAADVAAATATVDAATNLNTASTLVKRDASGNFSAGVISAALIGNVTGNVSGSSASFTGNLLGDVTGTQGATVVSFVGGSSAANVHLAELAANAATAINTALTIVKRDASGNFSATNITANITGNVSGSASSFTGVLAGDVTGTQGATAIASSVVTGKLLTGYAVGSNTALSATDTILQAFEKIQGQINATTGAAITALTGDVSATGPGSVAATVNSVGGSSAANIHSAELAANAATNLDTASTIVKRNTSGNFAAGFVSLGQLAVTGVANVVQAVVQAWSTQTNDVFDVLNFGGSKLFSVDNSGNGIFSGTVAASNFSGSSSGANTGDVTVVNTNSINLAFTSGQTGLSATLNLSAASADSGNIKATYSIKSDGLFIELPFGNPVNIGTSNIPGSSSSFSLADHVHAISSSVVLGLALTGYVTGTNTPIIATNSLLTAFENLQAQITFTSGAPTSIGAFDSQTPQANGLDLVSNVLYAQSASITNPGMVNTGTQSFAGNKTFTGSTQVTPSSDIRILSLTQFSATPATSSNYITMFNSSSSVVAYIDSIGQAAFADGNATIPAYGFRNNAGIGMYRQGSNILAFGTSSTGALYIDAGGQIGVGTPTPSARLDVHGGHLRISNNNSLQLTDTGSNTASLHGPTTISASYSLAMPTSAAASASAWVNDGSGNLGWLAYTTAATASTLVERDASAGITAAAITGTTLTLTAVSTTALTVNTTSFVVDSTNGAIGVNTLPGSATVLDLVNNSGATRAIQSTSYGAAFPNRGRYANGTLALPTAAVAGNTIHSFSGRGYGATGFAAASTGVLSIVAGETFTDTSMATYITLSTTPTTSVTAVERMRVNSTGRVLIGTTTDNGNDLLQVNSGIISTYHKLAGATSGYFQQSVPATVTTYTVVWPSAQGVANSSIVNDGSGNLSWSTISNGIFAQTTKTANYTILATDNIIFCDTSGGAFTLTLPTPSTVTGKIYKVIDSTGNFSTNNLTLARAGSEKLEGLTASKVLQTAWGWFNVTTNGTDWFVG